MWNEEQYFCAAAVPAASEARVGAIEAPRRQRLWGVAGQLRPYRDVRAGFEPWRRMALLAWAAREEALTVN